MHQKYVNISPEGTWQSCIVKKVIYTTAIAYMQARENVVHGRSRKMKLYIHTYK